MIEKTGKYDFPTVKISSTTVQPQERNVKETLKDGEKKEQHDHVMKIDQEKLSELVDGLNKFLTPVETFLKFELHEQLGEYYVTIVDHRTNEVIKEIPPKKMLDLYAFMLEKIGLIVDERV